MLLSSLLVEDLCLSEHRLRGVRNSVFSENPGLLFKVLFITQSFLLKSARLEFPWAKSSHSPPPCFHFLIFFFNPRSSIKLTSFCQNSGSSLLSSLNPHSLSTSFFHLQQHFPAEYYMRAFRQTSRFVARNLHFIIKEKSNRKCF